MRWEICMLLSALSTANEKFRQSARRASDYISFHALDSSFVVYAICLQALRGHVALRIVSLYAPPRTDETGFHEFCIFNSERLNKHTKWLIKSNCHMRLNTVVLNELVLLWVCRELYECDSVKAKSSLWNEPFLRAQLIYESHNPKPYSHVANTKNPVTNIRMTILLLFLQEATKVIVLLDFLGIFVDWWNTNNRWCLLKKHCQRGSIVSFMYRFDGFEQSNSFCKRETCCVCRMCRFCNTRICGKYTITRCIQFKRVEVE